MCMDFVKEKLNYLFKDKLRQQTKMKLGNFFESATKTVSIIKFTLMLQ